MEEPRREGGDGTTNKPPSQFVPACPGPPPPMLLFIFPSFLQRDRNIASLEESLSGSHLYLRDYWSLTLGSSWWHVTYLTFLRSLKTLSLEYVTPETGVFCFFKHSSLCLFWRIITKYCLVKWVQESENRIICVSHDYWWRRSFRERGAGVVSGQTHNKVILFHPTYFSSLRHQSGYQYSPKLTALSKAFIIMWWENDPNEAQAELHAGDLI